MISKAVRGMIGDHVTQRGEFSKSRDPEDAQPYRCMELDSTIGPRLSVRAFEFESLY